jgi:uncharacterized DUF497 family protein
MVLGPRKSAFEPAEARRLVRRRRHSARGSAGTDGTRQDTRRRAAGDNRAGLEGKLVVTAWIPLERGGRIVTARKATRRERRSYEEKS